MKLSVKGTHILSNRKFAKGFQQNGYKVIEIYEDNINDIDNKYGNFILLSNFMDFENEWNSIVEFGKKYDNLCYILWYWFYINPPFRYYIKTSQEVFEEPKNKEDNILYHHIRDLVRKKEFIFYRFSSYIDPISDYKKHNDVPKIYDLIYIGSPYEVQILHAIRKKKKYSSFIHILHTSNPIYGQEFERLYRSSKICLGFIAPRNLEMNIVTERIWEALSFGCLVLTNSKLAEKLTNGVVVFFQNQSDLFDKIDYYLKNSDEMNFKIKKGYEIFESWANYKRNALEFIELLREKQLQSTG